ncbi:ATP-binding protein [Sphaerothrix gracilis]|uniref:ATP-binding protein n=1 Tax=Sphaerothrix gracilis TaxID=3151835 RepID=UPI0031FBB9DE
MKPKRFGYLPILGRHFLDRYGQVSLPLKISLPFVLLFAVCWVTGTLALGEYFTLILERKQIVQAQELAALVERELVKEREVLRLNARLLATKTEVISGTATGDTVQLRQLILPLQSILGADVISIVDPARQPLLEATQAALQNHSLKADTLKKLVLTGSDVSTIVSTADAGPPVLIGTAPIKTNRGIVGGILVGVTLGDELLRDLNATIGEHLVIISDHDDDGLGEIVASSFSKNMPDLNWLQPLTHEGAETATLQHPEFTAQSIHLEGLEDQHHDLVLLLPKTDLNQAKLALWFVVAGIAVFGSLVVALVAIQIARKIAQPIQVITEVAQHVVQEENFKLRAPAGRKDEIGLLADALNQLIEWVGRYTHALKESAQTLESRVEARTQELSKALEQLKSTQSQLVQIEKMSSLGQMVAGIAHEINNPISFVQGNLAPLEDYFRDLLELIETYQAEYPQPTATVLDKQNEIDLDFMLEDSAKLLDSMKIGTQRVCNIVVSLRNYSRLDEAAIKEVDIHEGLDSTLLILNHRIKNRVDVIKEYGDLPRVRCSPSQLNQVFTNIIANALDAMFDANSVLKQLIITTRAVSTDRVQIRIRDTGPGMPPAVKAKIFDPFFTTKAVGKGTGLGMGICFKIIEQHRGQIDAISKVGEGSEFIVTLPIAALRLDPKLDSAEAAVASL